MATPDDKKRDVQSALASSLRLHAKRIDLGQAEMLTDVLLSRFEDLEQRLNTYFSGSSAGPALRKGMQSYLSRLNSNPLIPLHFRLKVLKRFEERLELFDAEMTAAVLNAHKIGVDMVQAEALKEPGYYSILVDMVSHAIELAGSLMRSTLGQYQAPAIITVRQVFDLMRLGMIVVPEMGEGCEAEAKRLHLAIVRYELLRNLDFFSKTEEQQTMMMEELKNHIDILTPYYFPKGTIKSAAVKGYSLLVTNMSRPNDVAQMIPFPKQVMADHLIVPMDDFIERLVMSIDKAENVLKNPVLQSNDMQIEESLNTTVLGGNAILDALRTKSRDSERQEYGNAKLVVGWSVGKSIYNLEKDMSSDDSQLKQVKVDNESTAAAWTVMNISRQGAALERLGDEALPLGVGAMLGLHWRPYRGEPHFAFIRWIRYPKPGEQQIGIEFYLRDYVPVTAVMLSIGDSEEKKRWSVLITFEDDGEHIVVFPDADVFKGMVFSVEDDDNGGYFKVSSIIEVGPNYSICHAKTASELETREMDSQGLKI